MTARRLICKTEADTALFGARLAARLSAPAFVALYGDLGAGKTALARGIGEALGARDMMSPSFTILREYDTKPRFLHFDAYRLSGAEELYAIGFADYMKEDALLAMEWADRAEDVLPSERLDLYIRGSGDEPREITLSPRGARYEKAVEEL